jgi:hypothetical protein
LTFCDAKSQGITTAGIPAGPPQNGIHAIPQPWGFAEQTPKNLLQPPSLAAPAAPGNGIHAIPQFWGFTEQTPINLLQKITWGKFITTGYFTMLNL